MRHIDEIIVHCTATRPGWWDGKSAEAKRDEVRRWHVEERKWRDIGYHYLIDRDGTVVKGRPLTQTGAHTRGHNKGTIGIALFGGHGGSSNDMFEENFTPEQLKALKDLIKDLKSEFPIMNISGHNQHASKACPCFHVPKYFK